MQMQRCGPQEEDLGTRHEQWPRHSPEAAGQAGSSPARALTNITSPAPGCAG